MKIRGLLVIAAAFSLAFTSFARAESDWLRDFSKAHPSLPVYMYPADHGFNCDQRGSYDAPSAKLARERTLEFLRKNVG